MAKLAGTSMSMLYQMGYEKDKGGRKAASELAGRIEKAAETIAMRDPVRFPILTRGDLSATCSGCEYFKNCKG